MANGEAMLLTFLMFAIGAMFAVVGIASLISIIWDTRQAAPKVRAIRDELSTLSTNED